MNEDELLRRLKDSEDGFVERKASFDSREIREAVVAFANSSLSERPGVIFVGVQPDGSIKGVQDPDALARDSVDKICRDQCFPPIRYTTISLTLEQARVLAILIPPSMERPHFTGHAYIREGSKTKKASAAALEDLITSRHSRAGKLLALRGEVLSIRVLEKQIGEPIFESHFDHEYEGRIEECDSHTVTILLLGRDRIVAEPVEWVTISKDTRKHRALLIVRRP